MYKFVFIIIFSLLTLSSSLFSQKFNWDYIGVYNDKDIYYDKSTVVRDVLTYVLVIAKPKNPAIDDLGKEYDYFTLKCIFYKNNQNEIRCVLSDRIYYYSDNSFRKINAPKLEVSLNFNRVISDLYNKVK